MNEKEIEVIVNEIDRVLSSKWAIKLIKGFFEDMDKGYITREDFICGVLAHIGTRLEERLKNKVGKWKSKS